MELVMILGLACIATAGSALLGRRRRDLAVVTPDPAVAARSLAVLRDVRRALVSGQETTLHLSASGEPPRSAPKSVGISGGIGYEPTEEDVAFTTACQEAFAQSLEYGFYCPIAGVSQPNDDGSCRRSLLRNCGWGERLELVHEVHNPYRVNSIAVHRGNGDKLGYLPVQVAEQLRRVTKEDMSWVALFRKHTFIPNTARIGGGVILLMCMSSAPKQSIAEIPD